MVTFNDTSTYQGLVQHLKFISGQDSLSIEDATRLLNFAVDDYTYIALTASKRFKFDDETNTDFPIATATLNSNEASIPLETSFLIIDEVQITGDDGKYVKLTPIDEADADRRQVLLTLHETDGMPEYYDYDSHSIFFYPQSSASRTVKLLYRRAVTYFDTTDTTATVGVPRIHHEYLPTKAAYTLSLRTGDPNGEKLKRELIEWEGREDSGGKIRNFYAKRDNNTKGRLTPNYQNNK
jgi:hypothetical protein